MDVSATLSKGEIGPSLFKIFLEANVEVNNCEQKTFWDKNLSSGSHDKASFLFYVVGEIHHIRGF